MTMTRFQDGPATGKALELHRRPMPIYLRVTKTPNGEIDALDQLEDKPTVLSMSMGETKTESDLANGTLAAPMQWSRRNRAKKYCEAKPNGQHGAKLNTPKEKT